MLIHGRLFRNSKLRLQPQCLSSYGPIYIGSTATSTLQGDTAGTSTLQGFLNVSGTNSTSTFSGGLAATYLNLTGASATSTFANGLSLAAGCVRVNGVCIGGVNTVSNADSSLTISPTTGAVVASLNVGNSNSWTALQQFQSQASTTMFSSYGTIYIGSTATSTLQGTAAGTSTLQGFLNVSGTNSTSTFSGGLAGTYLNLTGASATSTFANGLSLAAGCVKVNGSCIGGVSSVTNSDSTLTISPTSGAVVASLNLTNSNSWTALQKFQSQASTTMFSSYGPIYIGSTATSTLQGTTAGTSTLQGFLTVSGTNSTSTFSGGLDATYLNLTGASATSTFANGISLAAGCVKVNGVCIGGVTSVSNSDSTLTISPTSGAVVASLNKGNANSWTALQQFQSNASTTMFSSYGLVYIGSTATSTLQGTTAGTSTLQGFLTVSGTNSTSTFSGGLTSLQLSVTGAGTSTVTGGVDLGSLNVKGSATSTYAQGISLAAGCYAIGTTCIPWTTSGVTTSYGTGNVGIGTSSPFSSLSVSTTTSSAPTFSLFAVASSTNSTLFNVLGSGNVGIGTSTPFAKFSINPIAGDGASLIIGSSTATKLVVTNAGSLGLASSSPWRTLSVTGTVAFDGLTSSVTGNAVCITTGKDITNAGAANCVPSSERFKENIVTLEQGSALAELSKLRVVSFDYKKQYASPEESPASIGLIAEEVEKVDTRLVDYGYDGTPMTLHFERITGLTVQGIQDLSSVLKIDTVSSSTDRVIRSLRLNDIENRIGVLEGVVGSSSASLADDISKYFSNSTSWLNNRVTASVGFFKDIFADKITTKELCLEDVCLTKDQLKNLLQNTQSQQFAPVGVSLPQVNAEVPATTAATTTATTTETVNQEASSTPAVIQEEPEVSVPEAPQPQMPVEVVPPVETPQLEVPASTPPSSPTTDQAPEVSP
jgi:fibronectin-binding autotransporter adhesin